ncbi:uncharacterized protein RAG0_00066 [Rhynchosporium agropyri]|uniref:Uncharacterized protein n=1 Tax=Rhynchosporium agropyri TaxID=914238 RepID=A0A1E1JR44_9HELO|nr:uncharacterized protein RAG0_00066 [Rhynchosporium agropyri]
MIEIKLSSASQLEKKKTPDDQDLQPSTKLIVEKEHSMSSLQMLDQLRNPDRLMNAHATRNKDDDIPGIKRDMDSKEYWNDDEDQLDMRPEVQIECSFNTDSGHLIDNHNIE